MATLPACLAILFALSPRAPEAPCQDERPEDVGRPLPAELAPLVHSETAYCAMLADLSRVEFHTNADVATELDRLDARMRAAGATECADHAPSLATRCHVLAGTTLELTAHVDATSPPTLVLHVTRTTTPR